MLYIMRGTSCSGKDTLIESMFPNMGAHVLSSDWYRHHLFGSPTIQRYGDMPFSHMHKVLDIRLSNLLPVTIWNATNMRFKDAHGLVDLCNRYYHPYTFISIQPPSFETLALRNNQRLTNRVPEHVLHKHLQRYESCKDRFIEQAESEVLCEFIEVNQNQEVITHAK